MTINDKNDNSNRIDINNHYLQYLDPPHTILYYIHTHAAVTVNTDTKYKINTTTSINYFDSYINMFSIFS